MSIRATATGAATREHHEHQLPNVLSNSRQGRASSASAAERFNDRGHSASVLSISETALTGAVTREHHEHQLPSILRITSQKGASSASAAERFYDHKHKANAMSFSETATRAARNGTHHEHQPLDDATNKDNRPA